jgi:competence protein ComEA
MHPFLQENPRRSTSFCRHENHAIYSEFAAGENGLVRIPAQIALALALLIIPCTPAPVATASATEFKEPTLSPAENPVDINTATLQQLIKVPGMTRTWAARIIRFRPYRGKNELLDRGIVTGEVYARIKSHIVAHRIQK